MSSARDPHAAAEATLARVWNRRRGEVEARISAIETATDALLAGTRDPAIVDAGRIAAHKLAGSLGMFGFRDASRYAFRLEQLLTDRSAPAEARRLTDALRIELSLPRDGAPDALHFQHTRGRRFIRSADAPAPERE